MTLTEPERLARLETLIEVTVKKLDEMASDIRAIRDDLDKDKAELASLKNRGIGLLIGVGLAGGSIGALISQLLDKVLK